ncbi:HIT family protein [Paractinoplanes atraurantiacus]|uniref:Diadenosine tetraphosphate (Ap4A) hydrolase n=1 Tax=Paractinoplanes atraurantiacus TaxID=1036182 RepID=A0A285HTK8_9ACTN|nr:HIT family protein [Actinoplanes atraurantiacus]SNY38071.1 Diadenosine tetraphosphate (Ap4A) hydrolase [Actinoplanes atraurantiacus]
MPTLFTQIINRELPGRIVWEGERVVAFLTIAPLGPGHTLVVPRDEVDDWTELAPDLLAEVMGVAGTIGAAIKRVFGAPRVGLVVAGFEVPHAHVHVFPAWSMADFDFARVDSEVSAAELDDTHRRLVAGL